MTERTRGLIRFYFGIALAVLTVIVGALFIWQILDIYFSGHAPGYVGDVFSREIVGEHFAKIAPAFWIWIAMIIIGAVIWIIFPEEKKRKPYSDPVYAIKRLDKRINLFADYGEELNKSLGVLRREKLIIAILWLCVALFCTAGAIYAIVYLATPSHFPKSDITGEMINMVKHILPFAAVALILGCAVTVYAGISAKKLLPQAKKLAAVSCGVSKLQTIIANIKLVIKRVIGHKYFILGMRISLGCLGVAFVIAGIFNDSMRSVLIKAINICTECIGLG